MAIKYRTNDGTRWGSGIGRNLTPAEADINFWEHDGRLSTLEARPAAPAGIDHFTVVGLQFSVVLTDTTILGPYTLPTASHHSRGEWAPLTAYSVLDTFTINGGLYEVLFAHTSAASFDPGANDGSGHDYYNLLIQTPGSSLPSGGATAQVLEKATSGDYSVTWGWKLPTGGTSRQYLIKQSSTNQAATWGTPQADDIDYTPGTGTGLVSSNVQDAIDELASAGGSALSALTDVHFATGDPTVGALLQFDGTHWIAIAEDATNGSVLQYNGIEWIVRDVADLAIAYSQLTGSPSAAKLRNPTITALGGSGSVVVDATLGDVFTITPTGAVSLGFASTPPGAEITIVVTTAGTSSYNISFVGIYAQGTLATGTVNDKRFIIKFVSDGIAFYEVSRTTAM